jgi:hypothetical protein
MIHIVWLLVLGLRRHSLIWLMVTSLNRTAAGGRQTGNANQPKDFFHVKLSD